MKAPSNLKLAGAKATSVAKPVEPAEDQADGASEPQNPSTVPAQAANAGNASGAAAPVAGKPSDRSKSYGIVTKSWTSGGVGGTGAQSATIVATYPVVKDIKTGVTDFDSATFVLTFTDVDHKTTSRIAAYAFSNRDWIQIPQPEDGGTFDLDGKVQIALQPSGRFLNVDFNMSGGSAADSGSTPTDIGYIFELDIPADTEFKSKDPTSSA